MAEAVRDAERAARRLLAASWWDDDSRASPLPVDPENIARGLGIVVRYDWLPPDMSGKLTIGKRRAPVITINAYDHPNRQRFTCAHEIGHYVDRDRQRRDTFTDYRDTLAGLGVDSGEVYANQFAAALLMPAHLVQRYVQQDRSAEWMASHFGTSPQALRLRLRNLRLG